MKTIFFIGRRQTDNFSSKNIKGRSEYKFILMISEGDMLSLPEESRKNFDLIHCVKCSGAGILSEINIGNVVLVMNEDIKNINPSEISVVCQDEANVIVAGNIRELFNIKTGALAKQLDVFRDKVLMKECLILHSIRTPHFIRIDNAFDYAEITKQVGEPFIIKPVSSAGSFGVIKITSESQYIQFIRNCGDLVDYEAEEFIDGKLYHCDTVAKNKEVLFLETCIYTCPNLEFQSGKNLGSLPLLHDNPLFQSISEFARSVLIALNTPDGCHHMEFFINKNNELIFLEIGARAPGFYASQVYEKTFGKNPLDIDLMIQSGIEFIPEKKVLTPSFWMIFPIQEGKVQKLSPPQINSQYEISWLVNEGDVTKACLSNVDTGAMMLAFNKNYQLLKNDFETVSTHVAIKY